MSDALLALGDRAGLTFSYSTHLIDKKKLVDLVYAQEPLRRILDELFEGKISGIRVQGNHVSIRLRETSLPGRISGQVRAASGEALPGASVVLKGTSIGMQTDATGGYALRAVPPGKYTIEIRSIGYLPQTRSVSIGDGGQLALSFSLEEDKRQLNEVVVEGRTAAREIRESGFSVTAIDAKKYANTSLDVNQVLNRSTGVRIRESGGLGSDFTFAINGLSGRYVRFFIDGVPMENLGQAFNLNNFPASLVERIEVYKGVVPGTLGSDALGGAVNIVTNKSIRHFLDVSHSYGSFNTHRSALTAQYKDARRGLSILAKGFYNYSDNNYRMRNDPEHNVLIEVAEEGKWVAKDGLRRFYDRYQSGMGQAEVNLTDKKWADKFSAGFSYAQYNKQLQTGASVNVVNGGRYATGYTLSPSLSYAKTGFLVKGLSVTLNAGAGYDRYSVRDTASYPYDWSGGFIRPLPPHREKATGYLYTNRSLLARANVDYSLHRQHSVTATYNANIMTRHSENELDPAYEMGPDNHLQKHIAALSLNSALLEDRLSNNLFAKYYGLYASKNIIVETEYIKDDEGHYTTINHFDQKRSYSGFFGYGMASRSKITSAWGIKTSVEKTYRLLDGNELFGDGLFYLGNPDLRPESSYNFNLGSYYDYRKDAHGLNVEVGAFYRDARDFIFNRMIRGLNPQINEFTDYTQPYNAGKVQIKGLEAEVKYRYGKLLNAGVNFSVQHAIDNRRYNDGVTRYENITYKNKIPNQPWLFGNADLGIGRDGILGRESRLQLDWYTQYVHWFYLTWEALGSRESKNTIPTQLIHNASVTTSWLNGKYNLSLESRNLNNEIAYDNFRLQKAGRSFHVKLRCVIR